jgi:hypothetical protein
MHLSANLQQIRDGSFATFRFCRKAPRFRDFAESQSLIARHLGKAVCEQNRDFSEESNLCNTSENSGIFLVVDQDRAGGLVHDFGCLVQIEQPGEKRWMVTCGNDQISTQIACQR